MSTELDHAREIAERIARRVSSDSPSRLNIAEPTPRAQAKPELTSELAAVRAGLGELQRKIAQLEAKVTSESIESPIDSSLPNASLLATDIVPSSRCSTLPARCRLSPYTHSSNLSLSYSLL